MSVNSGPSTCRQSYDLVRDLEKGIIDNKDRHNTNKLNKIPQSPQLKIKINDVDTWALVDTGSQITAVSEKFYETIKCKNKIHEMPVSNVIVSTAIGNKNTTVKKQILLDFECDGYINNHICLIIPYLASDIILGNDWNLKNGIVINYNNQSIRIKEKIISSSPVLFERGISEKICTSQNRETTFIYIILINDNKIETNKEINVKEYNDDCEIDDDENEILYGDEMTNYKKQNNLVINEINKNNNNEMNVVNENALNSNLFEELRSIALKLTALTAEQKLVLFNLLLDNQNLFVEKPGGAYGYEYKLKLTKQNPSIYRSYSIPLHLRSKAEDKIKQMKETGIIERASGSICNPMRWIVKTSGDLRPCIDARLLNSVIEDDRESPPIISEMVQEFSNVNYYTKIDLKNSYWQIVLHKESRPYTAFLFGSSMYQFTRVPFGLKVAGSAFIYTILTIY